MGHPLSPDSTPDISTPGPDSGTGASRQATDARALLSNEYSAPVVVADATPPAKQETPDPLHDPTKTWEQKYQAVESYIRDHYYPKEKLEASNFYNLDKKWAGHIKTEADYIQAIKEETKALNDPWTEFTSDAEAKQYRQGISDGNRYMGIWLKNSEGEPTIEALLWGFPAYKSNLRIGDKITSVNGKSVSGMPAETVQEMLQGKDGSSVSVGFETPEGDKKVETLPLQSPKETHSTAEIVNDPKTGKSILHLGLLSFDRQADDELEEAIQKIPKEKLNTVSGIVLDLRGNKGGMLPPIARTGDMFVPPGPLFRIDSRDGSNTIKTMTFDEKDYTLDAQTRSMLRTLPMSILINGTTRSAPETLTASLKEHGRPCAVVGEKSFGKAIAFDDVDVPDGTLKITIEELKTPSGVAWQGKGLQPDIVVHNDRGPQAPDKQLQAAVDAALAQKR